MLNTNFDSWLEYFSGFLDEKTRVQYKKKHKGGGQCSNVIFKVILFFIIIGCLGYYLLQQN